MHEETVATGRWNAMRLINMEKRLLNIQDLCDYTGLGKTKIREILKRPSNFGVLLSSK